jgi:hypothetical protein
MPKGKQCSSETHMGVGESETFLGEGGFSGEEACMKNAGTGLSSSPDHLCCFGTSWSFLDLKWLTYSLRTWCQQAGRGEASGVLKGQIQDRDSYLHVQTKALVHAQECLLSAGGSKNSLLWMNFLEGNEGTTFFPHGCLPTSIFLQKMQQGYAELHRKDSLLSFLSPLCDSLASFFINEWIIKPRSHWNIFHLCKDKELLEIPPRACNSILILQKKLSAWFLRKWLVIFLVYVLSISFSVRCD